MVISKNTIIFQVSEGVQHFPGGPTFSRGVQMLISIKTNITCDFPGGSGPPITPSGSALACTSKRQAA